MSEGQANEAGIPGMDRFGYFPITYGKSNITPLSHRLDWRHIESVALGNGRGLTQPQDHAPVVTEWHWPSSEEVAEGLTDEQKDAIRGAINGGMYKQAPQVKDWVGHAVAYALGLDIDDEVQKKRTSPITRSLFKERLLGEGRGARSDTAENDVLCESGLRNTANTVFLFCFYLSSKPLVAHLF